MSSHLRNMIFAGAIVVALSAFMVEQANAQVVVQRHVVRTYGPRYRVHYPTYYARPVYYRSYAVAPRPVVVYYPRPYVVPRYYSVPVRSSNYVYYQTYPTYAPYYYTPYDYAPVSTYYYGYYW